MNIISVKISPVVENVADKYVEAQLLSVLIPDKRICARVGKENKIGEFVKHDGDWHLVCWNKT